MNTGIFFGHYQHTGQDNSGTQTRSVSQRSLLLANPESIWK